MLKILFLGASLALGQGPAPPPTPPAPPTPYEQAILQLVNFDTLDEEEAEGDEPKPVEVVAPLLPEPKKETPAEAAAPAAATAADRWFFMKAVQGTCVGEVLDGTRTHIYGWTEMSFTASTAEKNNQPVVWNDRANEYLLQQAWVRLERRVVTSGTTQPTFGYRVDLLAGSDYRFSLPRGLWNSQLLNSTGAQNLYGVDLISHYVEGYFPSVMNGLDIKVGRIWTPFGVESLEAVSTPFLSRSYAFNWSPPFTHMGGLATLTINPKWTVQAGIVNGNDVYIDESQELRGLATIKYTQPGGRNTITFGTSLGRGKINSDDAFNPATVGLMTEPAGRNNINVFDLVWAHVINSRLTYNAEVIFGYQTNVNGIFNAAGGGTAHWLAIPQYLFYTLTPRLTLQGRFEVFDDFEGQRTGFEGLYTATTAGLVFKPCKDVIFRPELRYDHNNESRPFEGKHGLFTAGIDMIIRW